jgi:thymidylate kinase
MDNYLLSLSFVAGAKSMIIAFMGNDGSGKTTIAWQIHKFFTDLGFETIYKHEHEYVILGFLLKLIRKEKKELKQLKSHGNISREKLENIADSLGIDYSNRNDDELRDAILLQLNKNIEKSQNKIRNQKKRSVLYTIWPILVWFDLLIQYVYYSIFKRRSVVLLDRYPYDQYLSFKYLGILTKFAKWLYFHFPKPDMYMVLTVSPEIAYERKKSTHPYSICFYETQTEEYLNLARILGIPVINTNDNLQQTVIKIIEKFVQSSLVSNKILHKANQNRVVFHRFREYELTNKDNRIERALWSEYEYRLELFRRSLHCIGRIIDGTGVSNCVLVKTIDDFHFVGNDIDILVSPTDFKKLLSELTQNFDSYDIREIKYDQTKDVGKMDVFPKRGLKLDIHSYIGWGNIVFFEFKELFRFIENRKLFGIDCKVLNSQINSFVIAAHGFEKGYLTLDEFKFIEKNFDRHYLYAKFPHVSQALDEFFRKLELIVKHPPQEYPIFFPLSTFAKCYLKLLSKNGEIWRLHLFARDLSLVAFWRCRYRIKNKLPFEVKLLADRRQIV